MLTLTVLLAACGGGGGGPDDDDTIPEPEILASRDGVLNVTLRQAPSKIVVAGQHFTSNVFNDSYIPPVLKLRRGDRMALTLQNRIAGADNHIAAPMETKMHDHGMSVTPSAQGDDVFLHVGSGADYLYEWNVPASHPQGPHWYHPHAHGLVETQILSGMSGMLIVDGLLDHYPAFKALTERHYIMKDIVLPGADPDGPKSKTINGLLGGKIRLRPGEMQVWNLGNLGADAYFDLAIDGLQFWEINRDGNLLLQPRRLASVFLPPGSRSTVIVVAPASPGNYAVRTLAVDTGPQGDENDDLQLATLIVDGAPLDTASLQAHLADAAIGVDTTTAAQLAALPVTRQRTITFSETADGNTFFIDGREYDVNRDDVTVHLGDVEEWTLVNTSG
ncbi:MAG: multicopper oxidase domain-containing protein, partial [Solirubrobacteraceae bacterium]|nr:multicopper oxidase domain-containing protein [Solirubrobacteraceae bacterium]